MNITPKYEITLGTKALVGQIKAVFPDIEIPLTQTIEYSEWQIKNDRSVLWVRISRNGSFCGIGLAVRYDIPRINMHYWYMPYGPVIVVPHFTNISTEIKELTRALKKTVENFEDSHRSQQKEYHHSLFVRTDATVYTALPTGQQGKKILSELKPQGIGHLMSLPQMQGSYFQPRAEWQISLKQTYAQILSAMHHKTRYSIKLAEKKLDAGSIEYEIITGKEILKHQKEFETLMKETAQRDHFCMHDHGYYSSIFKTAAQHKGGFLIHVYQSNGKENKLLVSNLIIYTETSAYYLFGTSSNEGRNLMPTYLAQWKALEQAKRDKKIWYNFGGISTENFPKRGWKGITDFKMKFGGEARVHPFMYDISLMKIHYTLYSLFKIVSYLRSYVRFSKG